MIANLTIISHIIMKNIVKFLCIPIYAKISKFSVLPHGALCRSQPPDRGPARGRSCWCRPCLCRRRRQCRRCRRLIIFMADGKIIEHGTFETLIAKHAAFYDFYQLKK